MDGMRTVAVVLGEQEIASTWCGKNVARDQRMMADELSSAVSKKKRKARKPSFSLLRLVSNKNGNADSGVEGVEQEVLAVHFIDVAVIVVGPIRRPRLG